jgi:hypothetical protein
VLLDHCRAGSWRWERVVVVEGEESTSVGHEEFGKNEADLDEETLPATTAKLEDRMKCPICQEYIAQGARKCIKCKSDIAGLRRYFSVSTPALAVATALVSVIGVSAPALKQLIEGRDSHLHATFVQFEVGSEKVGHLHLVVRNDGIRLGTVIGGELGYTTKTSTTTGTDTTTRDLSPTHYFVKEGNTDHVEFSVPLDVDSPDLSTWQGGLPKRFSTGVCWISLTYANFSGHDEVQRLDVPKCGRGLWKALVWNKEDLKD